MTTRATLALAFATACIAGCDDSNNKTMNNMSVDGAGGGGSPDFTMTPMGDMATKCVDGKVLFSAIQGGDVTGMKLVADTMNAIEPAGADPWLMHIVTKTLMKDLVSGMYESHGKLDVTADASSLTLAATGSSKAGGNSNKGASVMIGFSSLGIKICDDHAPSKKYTVKFECMPATVTKTGQGAVYYGAQKVNTAYCDYLKGTTNAMNTLEVTSDADGKASVDGLMVSLRVDAGGGATGDTATMATFKVTVQ